MRYQKIHSQIWQDEKFATLSQDAKFLFLYILTSPHSNSIGLYVLPKPYICVDLEWDMERVNKCFDELLSNGLILYDDKARLIYIKDYLKYNPIENEKHAKGAAKIVEDLPRSGLYKELEKELTKPQHKYLKDTLSERLSETSDTLSIPYRYPIDTLCHTLSIPYRYPIDTLSEGLQEGLNEGLLKPETETTEGEYKGKQTLTELPTQKCADVPVSASKSIPSPEENLKLKEKKEKVTQKERKETLSSSSNNKYIYINNTSIEGRGCGGNHIPYEKSSTHTNTLTLIPKTESSGNGNNGHTPQGRKPSIITPGNMDDEAWLAQLRSNPAYKDLDIDKSLWRMITWCEANGKLPTRRRFINWLNREDRPIQKTGFGRDSPVGRPKDMIDLILEGKA